MYSADEITRLVTKASLHVAIFGGPGSGGNENGVVRDAIASISCTSTNAVSLQRWLAEVYDIDALRPGPEACPPKLGPWHL